MKEIWIHQVCADVLRAFRELHAHFAVAAGIEAECLERIFVGVQVFEVAIRRAPDAAAGVSELRVHRHDALRIGIAHPF